jgi:hypothetical protein
MIHHLTISCDELKCKIESLNVKSSFDQENISTYLNNNIHELQVIFKLKN